MTPERWQQLKQIFQSALERNPAERSAFLSQACANDPELRSEVESLIASDDQVGDSIEAIAAEAATEMLANDRAIVGKRIGRYQVLSHIGRGGMGEVFLAQDASLGRKVALKFLPTHFTNDQERVRRFRQEARAASNLNHPNILTIYEIGSEDSTHFMATEYVEGETLRQRLVGVRMKLGEALDVAIQVASALAAAHEAGIVHRDIKPENIMVRSDGYAKVLDFGLAKLTERAAVSSDSRWPTLGKVETNPGVVMGTVQYMSPEQARGLEVDARTDIFSLGVVLYEMLSGRAPFEGGTTSDVMVSLLDKEPVPLSNYSPEVPTELQRIVGKSLRKDREERYQVVKDLLIDLKSLRDELTFEAKLERSVPPEVSSGAVASGTGGRTARTDRAEAAHPTSSAEYIVTGIKRHKRVAVLTLAALAVAVAAAAYFYSLRSGRATINSMAVLPFVNAGDDPDTEYLSDGITESLTNSLSQLPNLRMIARTSAQLYKGRETDPQTVARELGVQAVLTGRVVRRGDSLSISAELVDARDNSHIWGEQYNRRLSDVLVVQQEIAREIAEKLRVRLTGEERRRVTRNYTENVEAYQLYLRGRYHWNKRTAEGLRQAIDYFQQAIDRDQNYALAYSGLADCYSNLQGYAGAPPREMRPRARAAALRALEIDDSLAEAHASLGLNSHQSWQWAEAERELKRAIELNPNYASAHQWYSLWLEVMGRSDEALGENRRAQELDPLSPIINTNFARFYTLRGQVDTAINECRKVIELSPNFPQAHVILGLAYQKQGRHEEAIAELQKAVELSGRASLPLGALGYGYAVAGRRSEALAVLKELEDRYARGESMGASVAWIHAGLGDKDQAFASLEREFQGRGASLTNGILIYPFFDTLRSDPRYRDLLRRMGLPQ
jgi:serine/threonine protein kinase/Flp pilus assembly protein TadD